MLERPDNSPASTAILIPVLDRPHRVEPLLVNIRTQTLEPHLILFAASDGPTLTALWRAGAWTHRDGGDTWPKRINRLVGLTTTPYVFLGADDYLFHPGWLAAALAAMRAVDGIVVVNDLHNPNGTGALVSRRYIEEECGGTLLHEGYRHNYCDTEAFAVARKRGRWAYCPESVVEHLHPCAGKAEMDATYDKGYATLEADAALHESRRHLWA